MDHFDLSRQAITHLSQITDEIVEQIEQEEEYALSLAQNRIASLREIHVFQHVNQLDFSGNRLVGLEGIETLHRLESLNLARNSISVIDPLVQLPNLRVLNISENNLTQIDALCGHHGLMVIDASYNNIIQWPHFRDLISLESLDLSSNLLKAFPSTSALSLFPEHLRRLAISKNQIHETFYRHLGKQICGIGCLGKYLPKLEKLSVDGNPIITDLARNGAKIEFLWVNMFRSLSDASTSDSKSMHLAPLREEFTVSPKTVVAVQYALQHGDEATVAEFLRTGQLALSNEFSHQPPQTQHHFLVEELGAPQLPTMFTAPPIAPISSAASDSSATLSKQSKMEMWKRVMEDRKVQENKEKVRIHRDQTLEQPHLENETRQTPPPVSVHATTIREPCPVKDVSPLSLSNLLPPPPPPSPSPPRTAHMASNHDKVEKLKSSHEPTKMTLPEKQTAKIEGGSEHASRDLETLTTQMKALNEQVLTMRKYMKVWIKREQVLRDESAKRIQKWFRYLHSHWVLNARIDKSRRMRHIKYSFYHCSSQPMPVKGNLNGSMSHNNAQTIQRLVRGFLIRQRFLCWRQQQIAAARIQRAWKRFQQHRDKTLYFFFPWRRSHNHINYKNTERQQKRAENISNRSILHWQVGALANRVLRCRSEIKQLQRVNIVQEKAVIHLWNESVRCQKFVNLRLEKAVLKLQSIWRGHRTRSQLHVSTKEHRKMTLKSAERKLEQQELEITQLKQQLHTLQNLVDSLLIKSQQRQERL